MTAITPPPASPTQSCRQRLQRATLAAAARGTREGLLLAANIAAILISFIALVTLLNLVLAWIGSLWGQSGLSLQVILGTLLAPLAWVLGVAPQDCMAVGGLLGTRTVLNELVAYGDLGRLREQLAPRSFTLATIAMCSFANISSMGIQLGGIGSLMPERRSEIAQLGLKVLLIATLANFLSAAIAGLLL